MKYYNWNKAITEYFFDKKFANRQVLLNITKGGIEKISQKHQFGGIDDFKNTVLSFGNIEFQQKVKNLNEIFQTESKHENWNRQEVKLWDDRQKYPPFLACLVFLVLAIREEGGGYYDKLEKLITGCYGFCFNTVMPNKVLDRYIFNAWNLLENWSSENEPNYGYFNATKRNWGPHYTVIRVNSQKLLSNQERRQIYDYLKKEGFSKNLLPNIDQLNYFLAKYNNWHYQYLFGTAKLSTKWEEIKRETIINVVLNDLQRGLWEVDEIDNNNVLNITPFIINGEDEKLQIVYRCDIDETIYNQIEFTNYNIKPSNFYSGWSDEIIIQNSCLINGISEQNDNYFLRLKDKKLRVFQRMEEIYGENGWIETNKIVKGSEYLIFVHASINEELECDLAGFMPIPSSKFLDLSNSIDVYYIEETNKSYNVLFNQLKEIKESDETETQVSDEIIKVESGIIAKGETQFFTFAPPKIILNNYYENCFEILFNNNKIDINARNSDLLFSKNNSQLIITFKTKNALTLKIDYECENEDSEIEKKEKTIKLIHPQLKKDYKALNHVGEIDNSYEIQAPDNRYPIECLPNVTKTNILTDKYCLSKKEQNIEAIRKEFGWPELNYQSNYFNIKIDDKKHCNEAIGIFKNKCKLIEKELTIENSNEAQIIEIVKYIQKFEFLCKYFKKHTEFESALFEFEKVKILYLPFLLWNYFKKYLSNLNKEHLETFFGLFDDFLADYHIFLLISIGKNTLIEQESIKIQSENYIILIDTVTKLILAFIGENFLINLDKIQEFITPTKLKNVFERNILLNNSNIFIRYFKSYIDSELPEYYYTKFKTYNDWYNFSIFDEEIALTEIRNKELSGKDLHSEYSLTALSHHNKFKLFSESSFSFYDNIYQSLKQRFYPTHIQHKTEFRKLTYFYDSLSHCICDYATNTVYSEKPTISLINTDGSQKRYIFQGARIPYLLHYIQKYAKEKHIQIEVKDQPTTLQDLYPKSIFIKSDNDSISSLVEFLKQEYHFEIMLNTDIELSKHYLEKSISINTCINRNQLPDIAPSNQSEVEYFNPNNFRFEKTKTNANSILIKERHSYGMNIYYIHENDEYRKINCEWGMMYMLKKHNRNVVFYCQATNELLVPISLRLPKLIARALTSCTGFVPSKIKFKAYKGSTDTVNNQLGIFYNNTEKYNQYWYVYQNISQDFVKIVFNKLGQNEMNLIKR
jgi:hypothetical protein